MEAPTHLMRVSLIIPTCNRTADLRRCLSALLPQMPVDVSVEVLVTDDSADSASRDMMALEFTDFRWVQGPRRGPAANRNHGVSQTQGDWLLFLDDDCLPSPEFLAAYLQAFAGVPELSPIIFIGSTELVGPLPSLLWEGPHNPDCLYAISCNLSLPRLTFLDVGQFDERYPVAAFEDTEFEARCRASKIQLEALPEALVHHPLRRRPEPSKLAARWQGNCIFAIDQGASAFTVTWRLPWHVLRVIQSRFRHQPWTRENVLALPLFFMEWLWVLWQTPGWVMTWSRRPRNPFWVEVVTRKGPVPRFGF